MRLVGLGYVLVALATEGRDTKNIDHALSSTSEQVHFKHCEKKICCCNAAFEFLAWDGWKTGMDYMNKKDKSKLGLEQHGTALGQGSLFLLDVALLILGYQPLSPGN